MTLEKAKQLERGDIITDGIKCYEFVTIGETNEILICNINGVEYSILIISAELFSKKQKNPHYVKDEYEPIKIIDHYGLDFYEGNILKYLLRWRKKDGVKDLKKAKDYLTRLIEKTGQA